MRVRFTDTFNFTPAKDRRWSKKFKAGWQGLVTREQGDAAIAAGKAVLAEAPTTPRRRPKQDAE